MASTDPRGPSRVADIIPTPPKVSYEYLEEGTCRGCGRIIHWWLTDAGKRSPHDADGTSHFATCPEADSFRRARPPRSAS